MDDDNDHLGLSSNTMGKPLCKLSGPAVWMMWDRQIRQQAVLNGIWDYMDPDGPLLTVPAPSWDVIDPASNTAKIPPAKFWRNLAAAEIDREIHEKKTDMFKYIMQSIDVARIGRPVAGTLRELYTILRDSLKPDQCEQERLLTEELSRLVRASKETKTTGAWLREWQDLADQWQQIDSLADDILLHKFRCDAFHDRPDFGNVLKDLEWADLQDFRLKDAFAVCRNWQRDVARQRRPVSAKRISAENVTMKEYCGLRKLSDSEDWINWDRQTRRYASFYNVWDFMNPDGPLQAEPPRVDFHPEAITTDATAAAEYQRQESAVATYRQFAERKRQMFNYLVSTVEISVMALPEAGTLLEIYTIIRDRLKPSAFKQHCLLENKRYRLVSSQKPSPSVTWKREWRDLVEQTKWFEEEETRFRQAQGDDEVRTLRDQVSTGAGLEY